MFKKNQLKSIIAADRLHFCVFCVLLQFRDKFIEKIGMAQCMTGIRSYLQYDIMLIMYGCARQTF